MNIKIYTDGSSRGNPGPGGWACILSTVLSNGHTYEKEHSGGYRLTTNNRMELVAVINGFLSLNGQGHNVEVISDSTYVCNAFNKNWILGWKKSNWKNGQLPNLDMWQTLYNLVSMQNSVKFTWVKGHASNKYNNRCDELAVEAAKNTTNLEIDHGYENSKRN